LAWKKSPVCCLDYPMAVAQHWDVSHYSQRVKYENQTSVTFVFLQPAFDRLRIIILPDL
jgi:hypothetical protein